MVGDAQPKSGGKRSVEVQLLGQRMVLRSDASPEQLQRLATFVKRKSDEISATGPISTTKLALLVALNIAEDYFRALEDGSAFKRQVASKSRSLLAELEQETRLSS